MAEPLDVLVVGAGPAGLAVAVAAQRAGLTSLILEKGVLVNSVYNFPHGMTFFTTPDLLEIAGLPFVTPYEKPTRGEALRYYRRVADVCGLRTSFGESVAAVEPGPGGFVVRSRPSAGRERRHEARHVVVATGYYDHPNLLGIPGEGLRHVTHYYEDPHPFYRKAVVVVGAKNSAAVAALELHRAGASVTLVHRGEGLSESVKYWIRPDLENRIREGAIAARFRTRLVEIDANQCFAEGPSGSLSLPADAVFLMTGYHPDPSLLRAAGVEVDAETLRPRHDPTTLETNVTGLFVAGSVVAGRNTSAVFIETGRFHGDAIVAAILDRSAASPAG